MRQPPARKALLSDHESFALTAEQVAHRHAHIGQPDLWMPARTVGADDSRVAHHLPTGRVARHEDQGVVVVAGVVAAASLRHDDRERGALRAGDEPLASVEHPLVAVAHRTGLEVGRIRRRDVGLGHREARPHPALRQRPQVRLELLVCACEKQRMHIALIRRHGVQAERRQPGHAAFLRDQRHAEHADPQAAPLLRQLRRVDAALAGAVAQALDDIPALQQVVWVSELRLFGQNILLNERAHPGEHVGQLGRDGEVNGSGRGGRGGSGGGGHSIPSVRDGNAALDGRGAEAVTRVSRGWSGDAASLFA
jgi:hypothetical protein